MKAKVNVMKSQNLKQKFEDQNHYGLSQTFKPKNFKTKSKRKRDKFQNQPKPNS